MNHRWPTVQLRDVLTYAPRPVDVKPHRVYQEIGIRSHNKGVFHKARVSGVELGSKRVFWMHPGDFVLNIVFAWEGAVALLNDAEDGMIGSHRFPTFRVKATHLDSRFLLAYFMTHDGRALLRKVSPGGAGRNRTLSRTAFLEQPIPLPPLSQQRLLMARIEELKARINEVRRLRQEAAEEADALLNAQRREVFGERPQANWIPLASYVQAIQNGKSPATDGRTADLSEWGVLKVGAVSFGTFDERENKALPLAYNVPRSLEVHSGDFLMSRANTPELVGACALVRKTRPKLMLSDKIFRFVFRQPRRVVPEYLEHVLKSPALRDQIERAASGTSPTMKNISKEKVLALRVPPVELSEQHKALAYLQAAQDQIESVRKLQTETAAEIDALLPSVLDRAFQGEL